MNTNQPIPFDKRDGHIWFNGTIVPWKEAKIHVLNHGLHYGSCVFEGVRVYNNKIFKLEEHSQRLIDSANILGFEIPYSREELDDATKEIVKIQGITDGYIRPVAWRGSEQMAILTDLTKTNVAIACWTWPPYYTDEAKKVGAKLTMSEWRRPDPRTAPTKAKAAGLYMISTLAKNKAAQDGFAEALMLDCEGNITETTSSNFFLVINGAIHTAIPDCFLDGITRRTVIDLARERDIEVIERKIKPEDLKDAQEAFMTGTAAEVTPVGSIDDVRYEVGPISQQLMDDYSKLVNG